MVNPIFAPASADRRTVSTLSCARLANVSIFVGSSEEVAVAKLSENNYSLRSALNSFMANPSSPSSRDSANGESVVSVPPVHANSSRSSSSLPGGSDSSIASRLFTRANSSPVRRNTSAFSSLSGSISGAIQIPSSGNIDVRGVGGLVSRISDASSFSSRRERLLDSIFKPPYDIIFPGDFFSVCFDWEFFSKIDLFVKK